MTAEAHASSLRDLRTRLLSGGAWTLVGRVLSALAGFSISALASRLASPADLGTFFLAGSFVTIVSAVAQLGLTVVVVRRVAEALATNNAARVRASVIGILKLGGSCAFLIALFVGSADYLGFWPANAPSFGSNIWIVLIWMVALTLLGLFAESFRGLHDYKLATWFSNTASNVLLAGALFAMFALGWTASIRGLLASSTGAVLICAAFAALLLAKRLGGFSREGGFKASGLIAEGLPLMLAGIGTMLSTQADLWIVGVYQHPEDVAAYGAASRLLQFLIMPILIVNIVVPPIIADLYARRELARVQYTASVAATLAGCAALPILALFVIVGGGTLSAIFGDYYASGWPILIALGAGQTINAFTGPGIFTLMMCGHQRAVMLISLLCGGISALGGFALVGSYGAVGVACSAACGTACHGIVSMLWARRKLGIWTSITPTGLSGAADLVLQVLRWPISRIAATR
jgi:O-antigen/teichoic acid export membrane protein